MRNENYKSNLTYNSVILEEEVGFAWPLLLWIDISDIYCLTICKAEQSFSYYEINSLIVLIAIQVEYLLWQCIMDML